MLRRSFTWVVPGAVVAVGLFAVLDALRSSGGEPTASAPSATEAVTNTQTETGAVVEHSASLIGLRSERPWHGRDRKGNQRPSGDLEVGRHLCRAPC